MRSSIVHIVDTVLTVPLASRLPLIEIVAQTFSLQLAEAYLGFGRVADSVVGDGPHFFVTPWDAAFEKLDSKTGLSLIGKLQDRAWGAHLQDLLKYHILNDELEISDLPESSSITMSNGEQVVMERQPGTSRVRINGNLVLAKYDATNG